VGKVYVKTASGWVSANSVYAKTASGWSAGNNVFAKTASGWMGANPFDNVHPGYPIFNSLTFDNATRLVTYKFTTPADADMAHTVVKYAENSYPLWHFDDVALQPWSWKVAGPNQQMTYKFTVPKYSTEYFIAAWSVDSSNNGSGRLRRTIIVTPPTTAPPPAPSPTPIVKKVTYNCDDSGTWNRTNTFWSTSLGTTLGQGGAYGHRGGWFYGTKLAAALAKAKKIRGMTIKIQRNNSIHGVSGPANVYLIGHNLTSKGSGSNKPLGETNAPEKIGTLYRGETKTFAVPSRYWASIQSGHTRGLGIGLVGTTTTYTSPNYLLANGKGTTSGQLYMEWEE